MRILRIAALALIAIILLSSCDSTTGKSRKKQENNATLRVENNNGNDVMVSVLKGAQRIRLGRVNSLTVRYFRIPQHLLFGDTELQFSAEPIGDSPRGSSTSRRVYLSPGERFSFVIRP